MRELWGSIMTEEQAKIAFHTPSTVMADAAIDLSYDHAPYILGNKGYVVIFSLVALISMIVALAVGWVIGNVIFDNLYSMKYLVNPVNKIFGSDIMGRCMVPATILIFMTASFFVLGSVSFPKYTFVKTYGVLVVLQIVVNTVLSTVLIAVVNTGALDLEMKLSSVDIVVITLSLLMILLMLFNWIMGYVWLRNTDVID